MPLCSYPYNPRAPTHMGPRHLSVSQLVNGAPTAPAFPLLRGVRVGSDPFKNAPINTCTHLQPAAVWGLPARRPLQLHPAARDLLLPPIHVQPQAVRACVRACALGPPAVFARPQAVAGLQIASPGALSSQPSFQSTIGSATAVRLHSSCAAWGGPPKVVALLGLVQCACLCSATGPPSAAGITGSQSHLTTSRLEAHTTPQLPHTTAGASLSKCLVTAQTKQPTTASCSSASRCPMQW